MTGYESGVCNIDNVERKKRKVVGAVSFLNAFILVATLFMFPKFTPLYFAVFLLACTGFLGFLQSQQGFCTGLALKKKFKVNDSVEDVSRKQNIPNDRRKAAIILLQSLTLGGLFTASVYLLANI